MRENPMQNTESKIKLKDVKTKYRIKNQVDS